MVGYSIIITVIVIIIIIMKSNISQVYYRE